MTTVIRANHSLWFDRVCYGSPFLSVKLPSSETAILFSASFTRIMHLLRKRFYHDFSHDCSETCSLSVCSLLTTVTFNPLTLSKLLKSCHYKQCHKWFQILSSSFPYHIPCYICYICVCVCACMHVCSCMHVCACMSVRACALVWGTQYYNYMIWFLLRFIWLHYCRSCKVCVFTLASEIRRYRSDG